jgi:16S rRNA G966 N2-methylase RsmD
MISSDGVAIFQHSVREDIPGTLTGTFILTDQRRYGDTRISFFKRMEREKGTYI